MSEDVESPTKFQVFRRADAAPLSVEQFYGSAIVTPDQRERMDELLAAGWSEGEEARPVFVAPGFALFHVWIKAGYPLPLHSHNADCVYVVVSGNLTLGTEHLESGDGFFVPANAPYTYKAGPDGVELFEFRHSLENIDFRILSKGAAFWAKSLKSVVEHRSNWETAARPGH